jgi:hypothetical protein
MLTSFAEIYTFAAGGQVHCGFVAALYPGSLEACVNVLLCIYVILLSSVSTFICPTNQQAFANNRPAHHERD